MSHSDFSTQFHFTRGQWKSGLCANLNPRSPIPLLAYAEPTPGEGGIAHRWIHCYPALPHADTTNQQEALLEDAESTKVTRKDECMTTSSNHNDIQDRQQQNGIYHAVVTFTYLGEPERARRKMWETIQERARLIGTKEDLEKSVQELRSEALRAPYILSTCASDDGIPRTLVRDQVDIRSYEVARFKAFFLTSKQLKAEKGRVNQMRYQQTLAALGAENDAVFDTVQNRLLEGRKRVIRTVKSLLFMFIYNVKWSPKLSNSSRWRAFTRLLLAAKRWQRLQSEFGAGLWVLLPQLQVSNNLVDAMTISNLEAWIVMIKTQHPHVRDLAASVEPIVLECVEEQYPAA